MKKLLIVLLLSISALATYAQDKLSYGKTRADYATVFTKFIAYYNAEQGANVQSILSYKWSAEKAAWSDGTLKMMNMQLGEILSYTYIGPYWGRIDAYGAPVVYFKLTFNKPAVCDKPEINGKTEHVVCISLDEQSKIQAINFITSSFHTNGTRVKY